MTAPAELFAENVRLRGELAALRAELDAKNADKFAERSQRIRDAADRLALSDRTLLVSEAELPQFVPFTRAQIKRLRTSGQLRFIPDPLGRKSKFLYNLRDVEATLLAGQPSAGPLVRQVDWDKIRVAV